MTALFKKLMYKDKIVIEQPLGNVEIEGEFPTKFARNLHVVALVVLLGVIAIVAIISN